MVRAAALHVCDVDLEIKIMEQIINYCLLRKSVQNNVKDMKVKHHGRKNFFKILYMPLIVSTYRGIQQWEMKDERTDIETKWR